MQIDGDKLFVYVDSNSTIILLLVDGKFPPVDQIINPARAKNETRVTVNRAALLNAIKVCSKFAADSANVIYLETWEHSSEEKRVTLKLSAYSQERGEINETLEVGGYNVPLCGANIALNLAYLQAALKETLSSTEINLWFNVYSGNIGDTKPGWSTDPLLLTEGVISMLEPRAAIIMPMSSSAGQQGGGKPHISFTFKTETRAVDAEPAEQLVESAAD
jgi:DNA polymerase III sliding clamp (beta) subunit (PCNA family)